MKKQIFRAFLVLAVAGCASTAMAGTASITSGVTLGSSANSFSPSSKVGLSLTSDGVSYSVTAAHVAGSLQYGSGGGTTFTGDTSKILSAPIPDQAGLQVGTPTATSSATSLPSVTGGWQ